MWWVAMLRGISSLGRISAGLRGVTAGRGIATRGRISTSRRIASSRRVTTCRRVAARSRGIAAVATSWHGSLSRDSLKFPALILAPVEGPGGNPGSFVTTLIHDIDDLIVIHAVSDVLILPHPLLVRVARLVVADTQLIIFYSQAVVAGL